MTTTESTPFELIENPYTKDQQEAGQVNAEVSAILRVASLLAPVPAVQMATVDNWVRIMGQGSRECTRAMVWEVCNAVREHVANGIEFPALERSECPCPEDHELAVKAYNRFIADACAGANQEVVDGIDAVIGRNVYRDLAGWVGIMADEIAQLRFGD